MKTKRTSENVRVLSETESVCVSCGRVSILKSFRIPAIILHSCRIIVIDALNIGLGMPEIAIYYDEDEDMRVREDIFSGGDLQIIASRLKILC